jgi:guanine deaminase
MADRAALSQSLEYVLFALAILGDDRAVSATYVAGRKVHERQAV